MFAINRRNKISAKISLSISEIKRNTENVRLYFRSRSALSNIWCCVRQEQGCGTKWNGTRKKMRRRRWKRNMYTAIVRLYSFNKMLCSFQKQSQLKQKANREFLNKCTGLSLSLSVCLYIWQLKLLSRKCSAVHQNRCFIYIIKVVNHSHTNTRIHTPREKRWLPLFLPLSISYSPSFFPSTHYLPLSTRAAPILH